MIIQNALRVDTRDAILSLKALDVQADITDAKLASMGATLDAVGGRQTVNNMESLGQSFRRLDSGLLVSGRNWDSFGTKVESTSAKIESVAVKTDNLKNTTAAAADSMSASWGRVSSKMQADLTSVSNLITQISAQRAAASNASDRVLLDQMLAVAKGRQRGLARSAATDILAQGPPLEPGAGGGGGGFFNRFRGGGGGGAGWGGLFGRRGVLWRRGGIGPLQLGGLSLATMLGLGPEHLIGAGAAVGGSAIGAAGGAGLMGLGALGTLAVGGGSDLAVMKSTISGTHAIYQQYVALDQAVQTFGVNSRQAATAYRNLQVTMADQGPAAKAELALAKQSARLGSLWKQAIGPAKQEAVGILSGIETVAAAFVPKIGQAAKQNLAIVETGLKPLFSWLRGPQGMAVFDQLEASFKNNLPTAVHAFTQAFELVLRTMKIVAPEVGGITQAFDHFFTRLNSESDQQLFIKHIDPLLLKFTLWKNLAKALFEDVKLLFHAGAGEGDNLVVMLTNTLDKWQAWEQSPQGETFLHTFFSNRAQELNALIHLMGPLLSGFGSLYKAVQPMVPAITTIATGIGDVLKFVVDLGQHSSVFQDAFVLPLGAFLLSWRVFGRETTFGLLNFKSHLLGIQSLWGKVGGSFSAIGTLFREGPGAAWSQLKNVFSGGAQKSAPTMMSEAILTSSEEGAAMFRTAILEASGQGAAEMRVGGGVPMFGPGVGAAATGEETIATAAGAGGGAGILSRLGGGLARFGLPLAMAGAPEALAGLLLMHLTAGDTTRRGTLSTQQLLSGVVPADPRNQISQFSQFASLGGPSRDIAEMLAASPTGKPLASSIANIGGPGGGLSMGDIRRGTQGYLGQWLPTAQQVNLLGTSNQQLDMLRQRAEALIKLPGITDKQRLSLQQFANTLNPLNVALERAKAQWGATFQGISATTGNVMQQVQSVLKTDMQNISTNLGTGTQQGAQALIGTISAAVQTVLQNTNYMATGTAKGINAINKMLAQALGGLGVHLTPKQVSALGLPGVQSAAQAVGTLQTQGVANAGSYVQGALGLQLSGYRHAGGGFIGRPGERGPDDTLIWAGRGEAVLNDAHQAVVNTALRTIGVAGLPDLYGRMAGRQHGYAGGGYVGYGQLEGLWDRAGGPAKLAPLMAAIAMAESGGRASVVNSIGASGLWQIYGLPFPGNPLDPATNARMAVAKYRSQGLGAWVTYTSGAYRQFLQGGVPALGGLGELTNIVAPHIAGQGAVHQIAQLSVDQFAKAANTYLASALGASGGGGGGGLPGGRLAGGGRGAYSALRVGRTDQGLDFGGSGPVGAISAGSVLRTGLWPGWPGTGGIVYRTANGNVYVMEDFSPSVSVGSPLRAGQIVGRATGGPSGIETGWANASGTGPRVPYGSHPDGTPMPGGIDFKRYLGYTRGGFAGWYKQGMDGYVDSPTLFGAGEGGQRERVTITPAGRGGPAVHIEHLTVENHRRGDVRDMILQELALVDEALSHDHIHNPAELMR